MIYSLYLHVRESQSELLNKVKSIEMKFLLIILMLCSLSCCSENPTIAKFFMKLGQYREFFIHF